MARAKRERAEIKEDADHARAIILRIGREATILAQNDARGLAVETLNDLESLRDILGYQISDIKAATT